MPFFEEGRANGGVRNRHPARVAPHSREPRRSRSASKPSPEGAPRVHVVSRSATSSSPLGSPSSSGAASPTMSCSRWPRRTSSASPARSGRKCGACCADPHAAALVENFAGQWLHLRNLDNIKPNSDVFPDFDNNLRQGFKRETELFFASIVNENRSILDLLTADYTFVDERSRATTASRSLRQPLPARALGPELDGAPRAARQGRHPDGDVARRPHGAVAARQMAARESARHAAAAAAGQRAAARDGAGAAPTTMRERLESHRANPACASCHQIIDPLGFAHGELRRRRRVARRSRPVAPIDARGTLTDGSAIDGAAELREALLSPTRDLRRHVTREAADLCLGTRAPVLRHARRARDAARGAETTTTIRRSIVIGIVESAPFRMRAKARCRAATRDSVRGPADVHHARRACRDEPCCAGSAPPSALPFLEAMVPAHDGARANAAQRRCASAPCTCRTAARWTTGCPRAKPASFRSRRSCSRWSRFAAHDRHQQPLACRRQDRSRIMP